MTIEETVPQNRTAELLHFKLVHAVTEYDRKQSTKRGYNPYALGQYLQRIQEFDEVPECSVALIDLAIVPSDVVRSEGRPIRMHDVGVVR